MTTSEGENLFRYREFNGPGDVFGAIRAAVRADAPPHVVQRLVDVGLGIWFAWVGGVHLDDWTMTGYHVSDAWVSNRRN